MNSSYRPEATRGQPPIPTANAHILIAIGHFGRQVLWEQERLLCGFDLRVLVVRNTPKPIRQSADVILHYDRHHSEVWPQLYKLIQGPGTVSLVAAAGGVAGSMLTLRLAQEAHWQEKELTLSICTPFSWEHRRRYVRALYVVSRLQQMGRCDLSVVCTSRIEETSMAGELFKNTLFRMTRQAAAHLNASK